MATKRAYSQRFFPKLPKTFYEIRDDISDEINRRVQELGMSQTDAAATAGIAQPRMSLLMNKRYTRPGNTEREVVQAWSMLEVLISLGAHITIDVNAYSSPNKGRIEFVTHD